MIKLQLSNQDSPIPFWLKFEFQIKTSRYSNKANVFHPVLGLGCSGHWTCHFEGALFSAILFELWELLIFWSRGAIITIIHKLFVFWSSRGQTSQILNYWSKLNHWAKILVHCWRRNQHPKYWSNWAPGLETLKYWNYWKTADTVQ